MEASATGAESAGRIHAPIPRKPVPRDGQSSRSQLTSALLAPVNGVAVTSSGISSGRSTPIPSDAPPSVFATSSARKQVRAQQKQRLFPSIEYAARVSHFDPASEHRDFRGFFVLFWIGLAIMVITAMARNVKETGYPLIFKQWRLFTENIWELAISDFLLTVSTTASLPLQIWFMKSRSLLQWDTLGMAIQSIYQACWLAFWIEWPFLRSWTWTAQVFFTLHVLSLFMKMHSYAFYNGHLSVTKRRLSELDNPQEKAAGAAVKYPSPKTKVRSLSMSGSANGRAERKPIEELREDLALELTSPLGHVSYPQNLTFANYVDYLFCPTLCYELEYPRTDGIDWLDLSFKTLAVFGCIFLMTVTSEEFIIPVLDESARDMQNISAWSEGILIMAETISRLLFPFMIMFLLVFLVIFEYLLNAFADITCFADRQFYADWWNSCDWLEFSREWNKPVHHFFRRHVYSASRIHLSRPMATALTFLISALAHELVMGCITKKLRGYGAVMMMMQMPIVMVQRSQYVKGRTLLNNVLFWCSMILGLSMMCALYVLV